jgi:hypothetical protein
VAACRDARGPAGISASLEVDQTQLNRLFLNLVRIGETHGGEWLACWMCMWTIQGASWRSVLLPRAGTLPAAGAPYPVSHSPNTFMLALAVKHHLSSCSLATVTNHVPHWCPLQFASLGSSACSSSSCSTLIATPEYLRLHFRYTFLAVGAGSCAQTPVLEGHHALPQMHTPAHVCFPPASRQYQQATIDIVHSLFPCLQILSDERINVRNLSRQYGM